MTDVTRPTAAEATSEAAEGRARDQDLGPTPEEIEAWAAEERARRKAWLDGPNEEERAAYAKRARQRRMSDVLDEGGHRIDATVRQGLRYGREGQLAVEGALSVLYLWSRKTYAELVKAGREWEEETALPSRRRRVSFDDQD